MQQEEEHFAKFQQLVKERRVRPTLLYPLWNVAGYAIGMGTAMIGREAAMACHQAVEAVIHSHYNDQLRDIYAMEEEGKQEKVQEEASFGSQESDFFKSYDNEQNKDLKQTIAKFRDDEQGHHDAAVEQGAQRAPLYNLLYNGIKYGCLTAIWLTKRF